MYKMQRPSAGCYNCGGPVRTWKGSDYGWTCWQCVRLLKKLYR